MRIRRNGVKQVSRSAERLKSALKELALSRVLGSRDRGVVRQRCFGVAPQSSEQVGADRMEQVVATKVEAINEGERSIGTLNLRDRDCAIERHDRARRQRQELVVQLQDLPPVGVRRGRCVAVDGVDRRLELVRARLVEPKALPHDGLPFGNEDTIPAP